MDSDTEKWKGAGFLYLRFYRVKVIQILIQTNGILPIDKHV